MSYELPHTPNQWWDLVWYLPRTDCKPTASGWLDLTNHVCAGFSVESFSGIVQPVGHAANCALLRDISDETWCSEPSGLNYEVTSRARTEYIAFLAGNGLGHGDLALLRQGVYPLANTEAVRRNLGLGPPPCDDAALLVLGQNCD